MSEIGLLNTANSIPGDLTKTLLEGLTAQSELALQTAAIQMETQAKLQEQTLAMGVVAMMTGVGSRVNTVA